jgi:hypothetical protein
LRSAIRVFFAWSLCAAVLVATAARADAAQPRADGLTCGQTITESVTLSDDITCGERFVVQASATDDVTIDLAGHTVTILEAAGSCYPYSLFGLCAFEGGSAAIVNGRVVGSLSGSFTGDHLTVEDGSIFLRGGGAALRNSVLLGGWTWIAASDQTVEANWFVGGGVTVWNLDRGTPNLLIQRNIILLSTAPDTSGQGGIDVDATHFFGEDDITGSILDNWILGAGHDGILVHGVLQTVGALEIRRNVVWASAADGIHVEGFVEVPTPVVGGPVTLANNRVMDSGGHAINAPWIADQPSGVVDGGGNVALRSGVTPPCVGLRCRPGVGK